MSSMINCPVEGCTVVTLTQRGMDLHMKVMHPVIEEVKEKPPNKTKKDTSKKPKAKSRKKKASKKNITSTFSDYSEGDKVTYSQVLEMFEHVELVRLFNRDDVKKSKFGLLDEIILKRNYKVTYVRHLKSGWVAYRINAGNMQISWYEGKMSDGKFHRSYPRIVRRNH